MESSSDAAACRQNEVEVAEDKLDVAERRLFNYLDISSSSSNAGIVQRLSTSDQSPTDSGTPHLQIFKSELHGRFFTDEVASIGSFTGHDIKFPDISFNEVTLDNEEHDKICTFLLYLMSVHPNYAISQQCYDELLQKYYYPPSSVILNIFQNWGASVHDLFHVVPDELKNLQNTTEGNIDKKPKGAQGCNFNYIFQYIKHVLIKFPQLTYADLLEPFLRVSLDVTVFTTRAFINVKQCIDIIIRKLSETQSLCLKKFHLEDLDLQSQSFLCLINLRMTSIGIPLAHVTLQQFLGAPNITYGAQVDFNSLFSLVSEKREKIMESTYSDLLSFLKLIRFLLLSSRKQKDCPHQKQKDCPQQKQKDCPHQINVDDWVSILDDWSFHIPRYSDNNNYLSIKESITYLQHTLKRNL